MSRSSTSRAAVALATTALGLALVASPAFGHVNATGAAGAAGATEVTFTFTHGCGQAPTTSLRVQLPEGTTDVKAENPTGFSSTVSSTEIAWTGGSVPDGTKGSFTATMTLTGKAGDVVYFPTIQACATTEEAWIDKTPDAEAEHAAPRITLAASSTSTTEAGDDDHDAESTTTAAPTTSSTAKATTTAAPTTTAAVTTTAKAATTTVVPATSTTSSSSNVGPIIAAVIVAALVIGGVFALLRRRSSTPET